ncbi:hypothetical protein [Gluconacetobacter takamatsuzukensis]|uniref:Uncharacterized protein n=1 Tax=Gluconacetobacter takamatsuzukensis TaxID=1286190 RepID=A0A7W4KF39_9PROT|nr:hypothetical protein [Gluconacetobacter takamatsuzukensis]MBB2205772.1 hypothetical protein [Gluconacetobacter takamatsuzukensis]
MQRHLSTGSTLISALLAHDRPGRAHPGRNHADPAPFGFPRPPAPRGEAPGGRRGSRSGHPLGALIQIIAQGHADMME